MPLFRMRRLDAQRPEPGSVVSPEWVVSDLIEAVDGLATLAVVSALSVEAASRVAPSGGSPVVLRTSDAREPEPDVPHLPWMPGSRDRFMAAADTLVGEFWLWPSADGVLSDVPSTQSFFRARSANASLRLFLDPASLLTSGMLAKADDHLERAFAGLGKSAVAILLANVEPSGGSEGVRLSPLTRGVLSPRRIVDLWREYADPLTPVVLLDEDLAGQRAIVGM